MLLWDKSPRRILDVLLSSTTRKFYTAEIIELSGLSKPTVYQTLAMLVDSDVLVREDERFQFDSPFRAERAYYSINPNVIDYFRL